MSKSKIVTAIAVMALTVAACVDDAEPTPEPIPTIEAVVSPEPSLPVATPVPVESPSSPAEAAAPSPANGG